MTASPSGERSHLSTTAGVPVRPLTLQDAASVGSMLARAFAEDPTSAWLFPRETDRARALQRWYVLNAKILIATGEAWGTADLSSAALWLPMGLPSRGSRRPFGRVLAWNLRTVLMLRARVLSAAATTVRMQRLHPKGPGWYLAILGTEPGRQGEGLASRAMAPALSRCDRLGLPAYLDTATERDVSFYRARGFVVVGEVDLRPAPHFWVMTRPPSIRAGPT